MKSKGDFLYWEDYKKYLRQYYSGLAMQGILATYHYENYGYMCQEKEIKSQISVCIDWADELIKQLEL